MYAIETMSPFGIRQADRPRGAIPYSQQVAHNLIKIFIEYQKYGVSYI